MLTPQLMGSPADVQDGIALANAIVDTVRDPLVVLDQNLPVMMSTGFCSMRSTVVNGTSQSFESY
jgi:hypothetical protein